MRRMSPIIGSTMFQMTVSIKEGSNSFNVEFDVADLSLEELVDK